VRLSYKSISINLNSKSVERIYTYLTWFSFSSVSVVWRTQVASRKLIQELTTSASARQDVIDFASSSSYDYKTCSIWYNKKIPHWLCNFLLGNSSSLKVLSCTKYGSSDKGRSAIPWLSGASESDCWLHQISLSLPWHCEYVPVLNSRRYWPTINARNG
jgi:hypothetical protein